MATREAFLGRVRTVMAHASPLFEATVSAKPVDLETEAREGRARALGQWKGLLERFRTEFEQVGGVFHRVPDVAGAADRVVELAARWEATRILTWAPEILPFDLQALSRRGLGVEVASPLAMGPDTRAASRAAIAGAPVGLTGADFALAETGSLVLLSGAGRGRGVSLLPPYHVAIVGKRALLPGLADLGVELEALHLNPDPARSGAAVQIITGPSRTADIELTLTRGVHGPKEVHVVFVDEL